MTIPKPNDATVARIRAELENHQDQAYRAFMIKCNPESAHSIGVRIPIIRTLAKNLIKGDYRAYLDAPSSQKEYFEEKTLEGVLIATAPLSADERLKYLKNFVPRISDWCVCDTTCLSFRRVIPQEISHDRAWDFIKKYEHGTEFERRFMLVMMLTHFIETEYLLDIFLTLDNLANLEKQPARHETHNAKNNSAHLPHYTHMAAAWLLAEIIIKDRDAAFSYLSRSKLPTKTFNKAIQKACESYRVSPRDKKLLRAMKR